MKQIIQDQKNIFLSSVIFSLLTPTIFFYFFSNQNTYFLQSYNLIYPEIFANDWLANIPDSNILFTYFNVPLIKISPVIFSMLHFVFETLFFFFIVKLIFLSQKINFRKDLSFFLIIFFVIGYYLDVGIAGLKGQFILGMVYQPSIFGVFFITSIYFFLKERFNLALIFLLIPPIFHPSIMLVAMVIGLCYFFILRKSNFRYACILAIVGIVALLPHVIYLLSINSGLTESALGYDILAYEREPHHADSNSFNLKDIINSLIIVFGIIFCRSKSLRTILVVGSLFLFSSFILSEIISSSILSLMYPWRISIVLVPISFCIVLVTLFEFVTSKSIYIQKILGQKKYVNIIFFGLFLIFFLGGIKINENYWHIKNDNGLTKFLKEKKMYETPILIPIKMEHIRLNAQVPIFIDWKSAPKTGAEIIEWKRRIDLANKFYNSQTQNEAKEVLKEIFYTSNVRFALINQNIKMILDCECEVINDEFNLVNINDCVTIK